MAASHLLQSFLLRFSRYLPGFPRRHTHVKMAARDWDDKSELGFSKDEFNAASNVVSKGGKYDGQVDEGIRPEEDLHRRLKPRQIAMVSEPRRPEKRPEEARD